MNGRATNDAGTAKPDSSAGGFSLVEIMIALTVGAFVIVGMYQAFNTLHKWWLADSVRSDMRQNARSGMETLTRDLEMAGYQTTSFGDVNKTGLAVTLAAAHEIEMDQQRADNATIGAANPVYAARLVYYQLATIRSTGQQNLYRQIRTQPGLTTPPEIVAENVADFRLAYFDRNNAPVDCLEETFNGKPYGAYTFNMRRPRDDADYCRAPVNPCTTRVPCDSGLSPDPLKNIRRITVTLTTMPAGATTLTAAAAAEAATITVDSTAGFADSGKIVVFVNAGNSIVAEHVVAYTGKDTNHFTGCTGVPAAAAGNVVARSLPVGVVPKPFTLVASVIPQNLAAVDEVKANTSIPAVPTGLAVVDNRSCTNKLQVKWNQNPAADRDLAGYRIFYGPTGSIDVPLTAINPSTPAMTLNPDNLLITKYADRTAKPNTYAVRILAYDTAGNRSELSSPAVAANPTPDVSTFGGANDTTANPAKPRPPSNAGGAPELTVTAAEGKLSLVWPPTADTSPEIVGYRLYRDTAPFVSGAHIDGSLQIAQERTLGRGVTSWSDENLVACESNVHTTYYYAVAAVNCDETLVEDPGATGYHYNSSLALSDYAVASGSPLDTTAPPAPVLAGSPGQKSIALTLTNPPPNAPADFDRTEIFWSKAAAPHFNGTLVTGGTAIPNRENFSASPGVFKNPGNQAILFDREAAADPAASLANGTTYTFLAVGYDRCGNATAAAPVSVRTPDVPGCTDYPGPPPYLFSNPVARSCRPGLVELSWRYESSLTEPVPPDFAGFRIWRGVDELTAAPILQTSWTDVVPLSAGEAYTYSVRATDCLYASNPLLHASLALTISLYPGQLQLFPRRTDSGHEFDAQNFVTTVSDDPAAYTYHNNVKFWLQNTSQSRMTIKRMAVTWDNPDLVLESVVIGGAPSSTTRRLVTPGGAASGVEFSVDAEIADVATGPGIASGAVPVLLRFTAPSGAVNRFVDLRNKVLGISLSVWNQSFADVDCAAPAQLAVDVPRGPVLEFFSQSAPGRDGIDSYEVSGRSGTARNDDFKVDTGIGVNVFGVALDNSRDLFAGAKRFDTLKLFGVSASAAAATMPATGTPIVRQLYSLGGTTCDIDVDYAVGGDRYAIYQRTSSVCGAPLPYESGDANQVHWYYALAVDRSGNWDRAPNPDFGAYAYFQQLPYNVCDYTPEKPVFLPATAASGAVTLTWTAPTTYNDTGHTPIPADDTLTYEVAWDISATSTAPTAIAAGRSSLSFTWLLQPTGSTWYYYVRAKNSCFSADRISSWSVPIPVTQ